MSGHTKTKSAAFRTSLIIAGILAVFTVVEYLLALVYSGVAGLMLVGLVKAYLVVNFYMHISRLWTTEQGGH